MSCGTLTIAICRQVHYRSKSSTILKIAYRRCRALCNAERWTCASVKCVISSLLDNEVASTAGYLLNIVARDASRFVTNLIRREGEKKGRRVKCNFAKTY